MAILHRVLLTFGFLALLLGARPGPVACEEGPHVELDRQTPVGAALVGESQQALPIAHCVDEHTPSPGTLGETTEPRQARPMPAALAKDAARQLEQPRPLTSVRIERERAPPTMILLSA